ncbi:unnamed protein product [Urochloa decumbens]|uniref:Uncharacterized protein n=1 Tax=Urochloa decumbens TaxID=240449 RepID=A0ABC9G2V6_9POAL
METGAKKAAAPAPAAADARQALFETKHAELLSEAGDVAREFGADVHAVVFGPDGTAARHVFHGSVAREEKPLKDLVGRAVAMNVSAMGMKELAAHEQHLLRLRALVANELKVKEDKANANANADAAAPEQQVMVAGADAGSSDKKQSSLA